MKLHYSEEVLPGVILADCGRRWPASIAYLYCLPSPVGTSLRAGRGVSLRVAKHRQLKTIVDVKRCRDLFRELPEFIRGALRKVLSSWNLATLPSVSWEDAVTTT